MAEDFGDLGGVVGVGLEVGLEMGVEVVVDENIAKKFVVCDVGVE